MKIKNAAILLLLIILASACSGTSQKNDYKIVPLPFNKVTLTDNFWQPRMVTERDVTIPFSLDNGQTAIDRLRLTGEFLRGEGKELPAPHRFISSDLYKVMEGAAYSLMNHPDPLLEERLDKIIDIIAEAQEDDGYLYENHTTGNPNVREMGEKRYSWVVHSHELYNMGHMYEGAIAYYNATGKDKWLKIAVKNAQHINKVFFEGGDPKYNDGKPVMQAPGHEEIELALCKLYRTTEDRLYLDMAKKFLDIRGVTYRPEGEGIMSPTYAQQHAPVTEQTEAVGHAVRAGYLYCGMADVDALTGRKDYDKPLQTIWSNLVNTRMHITGGLGAVHGIEGFGAEYELPNRDAYNETCAAVTNVFFNYRMFLLHQDAKYFDIAELSLFNNALAGINIEGNLFFYENPLECDGIRTFNKGTSGRAEWFGTACCPPNISRLILQTPGYMYSYTRDKIYFTLYAGSEAQIPLKNGNVNVTQLSDYPFDGKVEITLNPDKKQKFKVYLRIPTWSTDESFVPGDLYSYKDTLNPRVTVLLNGNPFEYNMEKGFAVIDRKWAKGDKISLDLPMPVRFVKSHPNVVNNAGHVAITRGPLVYCAEETDNGGRVQRLFLPETSVGNPNIRISPFDSGILKGIPRIEIKGEEIVNKMVSEVDITLIPYYSWNNRKAGPTMIVWMPETRDLAESQIPGYEYLDNIKKTDASFCSDASDASVEAICDGGTPVSSDERGRVNRWYSSPRYGENQWVSIDFKKPSILESLAVYWADRSNRNDKVKIPKSWSAEYRIGNKWYPFELYLTDSYETRKDQFNVIHPAKKIICDGVRINMEAEPGFAVGIIETEFRFGE